VSTAFGVCEIHKVKAEDGAVRREGGREGGEERGEQARASVSGRESEWTHISMSQGHTHTHTLPPSLLPSSQELEGWLWFDEKDQINVLARMEGEEGREGGEEGGVEEGERGKFLVFEQRKYGFEGLR
jgi:hypothetical protein